MIIQFSEAEINKEDYISEYMIEEEQVEDVANSPSGEVENPQKSIEDFIKLLPCQFVDFNQVENSIIFKRGFRDKYSEDKFNELKELIKELSAEPSENKGYDKISIIKNLIDDRLDVYVSDEEYDCQSFDSFVSFLEEDRKYYMGGVIHSHY